MSKMRKHPKLTLTLVFALVMVMIMAIAAIFAAVVAAQSKTVSRLTDVDDKHSAAEEVTTKYQSEDYSIALGANEWIQMDMNRFKDIDTDFYANSVYVDQAIEIWIEDSDDDDNYIWIKVTVETQEELSVRVVDHFDGSDTDDSETGIYEDFFDNENGGWGKISIRVDDTSDDYDGTKHDIKVEVGGTDAIDMEMISPEVSEEMGRRNWDIVRIKAHSGNDGHMYIDDWDIDTNQKDSIPLNYTWLILFLVGGFGVLAWVLGIPPFRKDIPVFGKISRDDPIIGRDDD